MKKIILQLPRYLENPRLRTFLFMIVLTSAILSILLSCNVRKSVDSFFPEGVIPPVTLLTTTYEYDPIRYQAAYKISEWWREIGLEVNVIPLEFNELTESIRDLGDDEIEWDAFIYGWSGRIERADPDMFIYSISHSSQADVGGNNTYKYRSPDYDALAEAQRRIMDPEVRRLVVHAAQSKLAKDVPFVSLYYRYVISAYQSELWENVTAMPGEGIFHEWIPFHVSPVEIGEENLLVIGGNQKPSSLNPLTATTVWEWKLLRLFYDKLVRVNQYFRPEPWAASEVRQITDTIVEIVLRDDLAFHDGRPVRPEDVKFTFDYMIENDIRYFAAFLSPIVDIELTDEGYIRFHLEEPYAPFIPLTLAQIPILPEHLWFDWTPGTPVPVIGSGSLKFASWDSEQELIFTVNNEHFSADKIRISGLKHKVYSDVESIIDAMVKQEVGIMDVHLDPEFVDRLDDIREINVITVPDIGFHFLGFNNSSHPFNHKSLRVGAAKAINLELIVKELLKGYGDPGGYGQPISTGNPFWKNTDVSPPVFDVDKARIILEEAGYTWNEEDRLIYPKN